MTRVAGYEQRLRAMIFKANFAEKAAELRRSLEVVSRASRELVSSRRLARVFELILAMGNFLNRGNARIGGAEAFRISSLDKVRNFDFFMTRRNIIVFRFFFSILLFL